MTFAPDGTRIRQKAMIVASSLSAASFDFGAPIEFDVSESETHRSSSKVTDHPIESGAEITDHIVAEPDTLDISARVSNTPIVSDADAVLITTARAEEAYALLREIKEKGATVDVVTTLRTYEGMALTELSVQRSAQTGDVLAVSLRLRQIRTVTSETLTDVATPKVERGKKSRDSGKKIAEPAPAPVAAKSETLLLQLGRKISTNLDKIAGP